MNKNTLPDLMAVVKIKYVANPDFPGIYIWTIKGVGRYVGKYSSKRRPLSQYARNVHRILNQEPYRKNNPNGFRHIHRALVDALKKGLPIELIFFENVPLDTLRQREKELIAKMGELNRAR